MTTLRRKGADGMGRFDAIALGILGVATGVTLAVYTRLPARVPVHFDIHGNADGFLPRAIGAFLLPLLCVVTWFFVRHAGKLLPPSWRARYESSPTAIVGLMVVALMSMLQLVVLYAALRPGLSMGFPIGLVLSLSWILMGQLMPRVRRNPFVGVRTTWTLSSDENWARTHRVAGWAFTIGGVVGLLGSLFGLPAVAISAVLISGLWPVVYSYLLARRLEQG